MDILKKDKRLWDENNLNKPLLFELLENYDKELFELLFSDKDIKAKFFVQAGESYVFKYEDFRFAIEQNNLDGSYTKYVKNSIGISNKGKFLTESTDYVLEWPFKDTILQGGMSSEEGEDTYIVKKDQVNPGVLDKKTSTVSSIDKREVDFLKTQEKRKEIFYNNIIAQDEVDQLLKKKAFKNFKRYTSTGEEDVTEIKRDENGIIKENLIIKGNNLLALSSLEEQFTGKIKLIYIDPPYGKDVDTFYNDRFKTSTWLTFMKNRLEIAQKLLSEDGVIFVQIEAKHVGNLRVLMEEIFNNVRGVDNYLATITCKVKAPSGVASNSQAFFDVSEYIIGYKKNTEYFSFNQIKTDSGIIDEKNKKVTQNYNILINDIDLNSLEKVGIVDEKVEVYKVNKYNIETIPLRERTKDTYFKNFDSIARTAAMSGGVDKKVHRFILNLENPSDLYVFRYTPTKGKNAGKILDSLVYKKAGILYLKDYARLDLENKVAVKEEALTTIFSNDWWQGIANEGGVQFKNGKKPEKLLKTLIEVCTNPGDVVLDFHSGSGTTAAVSHKLNRQHISIEQMNYEDNDTLIRLKNVVKDDTTGISKQINWRGGGDFIYFELAEYNEEAKNKIDTCTSYKELKKLFTELTDYYFLNYNVSVKQFNDEILDDKDFQELPLEEQKSIFKALLDNNQLYISYDEQDDTRFNLSEEDRKLTEMFYE